MYFVTSTLVILSIVLYGNAATATTTAQQVGSTLVGSVDSNFGHGISLSSNGLVLAVGAPGFNSGSDIDAGQVSIYNFDGTNWIPGMTFIGTDQERIGERLSLSASGDHLAFRRARISTPDVAVIIETATGNQLGQELSCAFNGFEVSLAPSGTRVAVSCETFSTTGRVEVFDLIGNTWISIGTIDGDDVGSLFGWVTAFDLTGNRLAVAAPNQDSNSLQNNGMVRVYDYDGAVWNQVGSASSGGNDGEQFGFSLDISSDGTALVVGSPQNDGNGIEQGRVTIYRLVGGTVWQLMGSAISTQLHERSRESFRI